MPETSSPIRTTLSEHTSYQIGGPTLMWSLPGDPDEVLAAVGKVRGEEISVLGHGTNVLASDAGYDGIVLKIEPGAPAQLAADGRYTVSAGARLDDVVRQFGDARLYGLEQLCGIPGTVGGAIVQNAGAYAQEIADVIETVTCVNILTEAIETLTLDECRFGYRDSKFKQNAGARIVVECTMNANVERISPVSSDDVRDVLRGRGLDPDGELSPGDVGEAIYAVREHKDHVLDPQRRSIGSFFMNPRAFAGDPAFADADATYQRRRRQYIERGTDWLKPASALRNLKNGEQELVAGLLIATAVSPENLEDTYYPGRTIGQLRLGAGGPNTIINDGQATAVEVLALADELRTAVAATYPFTLAPEAVMLGEHHRSVQDA